MDADCTNLLNKLSYDVCVIASEVENNTNPDVSDLEKLVVYQGPFGNQIGTATDKINEINLANNGCILFDGKICFNDHTFMYDNGNIDMITGNLTLLTGNINILTGTLHVGGTTILDDKLTVNAETEITGDMTFTGTITLSGDITMTGDIVANSIETFSDEKFKTNIKTLNNNVIDKVRNLNPVTYNWNRKDFPNFPESQEIGLIAQELQEHFPELVHNKGEYLTVSYDKLCPILIKCIQNLDSRLLKNSL